MSRWITKNGRKVKIGTGSKKTSTLSSNILDDPTKKTKYRFIKNKRSIIHEKKWYQEGWRQEIRKIPGTNFAVDFGNFGGGNFSFVVREGNKEIFSVPKFLLKNAVSYGLATVGVPAGIPFDLPITAIEQGINLYNQFK